MNAMVGDAGNFSTNGFNINNPGYTQFFNTAQIPEPSEIFVFLDEHPDSIDDGYFLNKSPDNNSAAAYGSAYGSAQWTDLPASYHNGATAFSYADGHSSLHRWLQPDTIRPPLPNAANLPIAIPSNPATAIADFDWVMDHMSVDKN
jgi:prepilin-type processing-associated H-X9-DG protein